MFKHPTYDQLKSLWPAITAAPVMRMVSPLTEEEFKLWMAALRSGEFRQGRGRLKAESGGYCCLGVLQSIRPYEEVNLTFCYLRKDDVSFGLSEPVQLTCAYVNDGGNSFNDVADILEGLFYSEE